MGDIACGRRDALRPWPSSGKNELIMQVEPWDSKAPGVVELPSGRRVRGRGLRRGLPRGPVPTLAVHLTGRRPPQPAWERHWVRWIDFWVPSDFAAAQRVLRLAYTEAVTERVEIACGGGVGRTGTALAALAILDGMDPDDAVTWVRRHYHPRAVEVAWQRRFLSAVAVGPDGDARTDRSR